MECYIERQNEWSLVLGTMGIGKTSVSRYLGEKLNMQLMDWEVYSNSLKERLGGEDGPLEELPFGELLKQLKSDLGSG